ncbi:hypothetical protein DPMN_149608 [Dreissena polymorpha]|uniref:Uncharacterized protein n=1 Tax=Dreissena polymorpha TaxID=45954 RepID=A0A9D4FBN6_DREPO|nr:hypothetical protein DPMN_149608 [Dreissena polymorpha]
MSILLVQAGATLISEQNVRLVCSCHMLVLTCPSVTQLTVAWCNNKATERQHGSQSPSAETHHSRFRRYESTMRSNNCLRCICCSRLAKQHPSVEHLNSLFHHSPYRGQSSVTGSEFIASGFGGGIVY